jgi:hypothetical protein
MKATGKVKITEELTLNNPTGEIKSVTYDWSGTDNVSIEIIFIEEGSNLKNSRTFTFKNEGSGALTGEAIKDYISNHPELKAFNNAESAGWFTKLINYLNPLK